MGSPDSGGELVGLVQGHTIGFSVTVVLVPCALRWVGGPCFLGEKCAQSLLSLCAVGPLVYFSLGKRGCSGDGADSLTVLTTPRPHSAGLGYESAISL